MIVELTLITTFIIHHLVLGVIIGGLVWGIFKLPFNISTEAQSRLWFVSYLIITLVPFIVFITPQNMPYTAQISLSYGQNELVSKHILPIKVLPKEVLPINSDLSVTASNDYWNIPEEIIYNLSSLLILLLALWALGIIWRVAVLTQRLNNSSSLAKRLKSKREITLFKSNEKISIWLSSQCQSPMVIGIISPKIVIPNALFSKLNEQQLQHVVLHEQAHIDRRDLITTVIQELISITFWWSPILRPLNRQIYLARELACDIRAANKSADSLTYAQTLLDCAKLMFQKKQNVLAMSLFSKQKDLTIRINGVIGIKSKAVFSLAPSMLSCALLIIASVSFAHSFSPKINLPQIKLEAKLFLRQTPADSQLMIDAVAANRISVIKQLIAQGVDIDVASIGDGTALIMAVRYENIAMVDALLKLGANVNQPSLGDGNPLIMATKTASIPMLEQLLKAGAQINNIVKGDETPLINASHQGDLDVVKFLVENGADVNLAVKTSGFDGNELRSPLNRAKTNSIRQYLISQGAI